MNSPTLRMAAAQMASGPDPVANLASAVSFAERAADLGAAVVVYPEAAMACFGTRLRDIAEPLDGPFASGLRACASRLGITLVAGLFEPAGDEAGRVYNTLLLTGPDGDVTYRKIHLYDAFGSRESDTVAPGDTLVTTTVSGATVGLATCYDLRFADQFTALGKAGASLILVPAAWGDGPGKAEQWDVLVRARAMDAQAYLVACDQAWQPPVGAAPLGIGRSAIIDPLGVVRAQLNHEAGLLVGDVDLATVAPVRERVPILR